MLKFQPPMLNDEVCRMATDKQTHKYIHTQKKLTYRVKTEETFFAFKSFYFSFSFKKAVSKNNILFVINILFRSKFKSQKRIHS